MRTIKHKFFTSGKPMKRRLAYRIYDDLSFVCDLRKAYMSLYNTKDVQLTYRVVTEVSKELGMTDKQFIRRYKKLGCHNKDQINRAMIKVDRDLNRSRRPDLWTRYKCGQKWRAKFAESEFGMLVNKGWGDMADMAHKLTNMISKLGISCSHLTMETHKLTLALQNWSNGREA